jgi:hypothetical protein
MGVNKPNYLEFIASVYKVQTLVDNGIRVYLDLSENNTMQMAMLAECQRMGVVLQIEARPIVQSDVPGADGKKSRPDRKSLRGS